MRIAVYCGAAEGRRPSYLASAERLGRWMVEEGHELIYGAGQVGMMGRLADTVLSGGGRAVGVIPRFMVELGWCHQALTECVVTEDMSSRIRTMCDRAEAMIALPGGAGTLEEISGMISWQRLGLNDRPCVLFNTEGYYEPLRTMYGRMVSEGFLEPEGMETVLFSEDLQEIGRFLRGYVKRGRTTNGGY